MKRWIGRIAFGIVHSRLTQYVLGAYFDERWSRLRWQSTEAYWERYRRDVRVYNAIRNDPAAKMAAYRDAMLTEARHLRERAEWYDRETLAKRWANVIHQYTARGGAVADLAAPRWVTEREDG